MNNYLWLIYILPRECAILWIFRGSSLGFVIGIVSPSSLRFTSVQASSDELCLFSLSVVTSEGLGSAVILLRCTVSSLESLLWEKIDQSKEKRMEDSNFIHI